MQEQKQKEQEEFHSDISNEYEYHDFNLLCSLAYTGCCIMDTNFETAEITLLFHFESTNEVAGSISDDDDDDDDDDNNNNN